MVSQIYGVTLKTIYNLTNNMETRDKKILKYVKV